MTLSSLCDNIGAVGGNTVSADPQLMHVHVQELLILQMFGVDSPSQDLIENLEIRLQSQLDVFTLSLITDDLFRYPQLRIKFSELQFIQLRCIFFCAIMALRSRISLKAQSATTVRKDLTFPSSFSMQYGLSTRNDSIIFAVRGSSTSSGGEPSNICQLSAAKLAAVRSALTSDVSSR